MFFKIQTYEKNKINVFFLKARRQKFNTFLSSLFLKMNVNTLKT